MPRRIADFYIDRGCEQRCDLKGATRAESLRYAAKARSIAIETASPPRTACV